MFMFYLCIIIDCLYIKKISCKTVKAFHISRSQMTPASFKIGDFLHLRHRCPSRVVVRYPHHTPLLWAE